MFSVFFKVFDRVSWWSFRVSKPFSILSLILLNHIHKNAVFRPNILNYLNTAFTFGKRTKDTFINRTIQYVYEFTDSLIFVPAFFWGEGHGGSSPNRTRNTSRSTAISNGSACSTPRRDQERSEM